MKPHRDEAEQKTVDAGVVLRFRQLARRLGPVGPLALLATVGPPLGGMVILTTVATVGPWLQAHGPLGVVLFMVTVAVLAGLAVLPTYAQSLLAGWAFGVALGFPAVLVALVAAAMIAHVCAAWLAGDRVERMRQENPQWLAVRNALVGAGFLRAVFIVTLVRLPPNSPFALTNLLMASVGVPRTAYALGTALGLAPRTAAAVFIGAQLSTLTLDVRPPLWMILTGIALTIAVLAVIGAWAKRVLRRTTATAMATPTVATSD